MIGPSTSSFYSHLFILLWNKEVVFLDVKTSLSNRLFSRMNDDNDSFALWKRFSKKEEFLSKIRQFNVDAGFPLTGDKSGNIG